MSEVDISFFDAGPNDLFVSISSDSTFPDGIPSMNVLGEISPISSPFSDTDASHEHNELESLLSQICYAFSDDGDVGDDIVASPTQGSAMDEIPCAMIDPTPVMEFVEANDASSEYFQENSVVFEREKNVSQVDDTVEMTLENAVHSPSGNVENERAVSLDGANSTKANDEYIGATSQEKEYSCMQCGKRFKNRRANAAAHVREVHLQIRMNACLLCNYKSNRTSNVTRHVRSRHGIPFLPSSDSAMGSRHNKLTC